MASLESSTLELEGWMTYINISKCPSVFVDLVCSRTVGYLFAPGISSSFLQLLLQAALQAAFLLLLT